MSRSIDARATARRLLDEAEAFFADPDHAEAPEAIEVIPLHGARLLITYGGPTVELILERADDEYSGRIEASHGRDEDRCELTAEEAERLYVAYGLDVVEELRRRR
jgi:hypothetical protein